MTPKTIPRVWTIALIGILALTVWFFLPQLSVIAFTGLMALLFYPLYLRLKRKKGRLAATTTLIASFLVVLIPLTFIVIATVSQLASFAESASLSQNWEHIPTFAQKAIDITNDILAPITGERPTIPESNVIDYLKTAVPTIARAMANILLNVLSSLPQLGVAMIIYVFLFIEFLLRGPQIVAKLEALSPFDATITKHYFERIVLMAKAMVTGQLIIAMTISLFASILLTFLGYGHYFFIFFIVITILNFVPLGGGFIVVPVAVYSMMNGQFWPGLVVIVLYYLFGNIEPILRTHLIPKKIQLSVGLTLISTFCGIAYFGILGVVYGPIIMIIIMTTINFYIELKAEYLEPQVKNKVA